MTNHRLTKRGAGSLTLSGTNTWRGLTTVEEGTLIAAIPAALPAASGLPTPDQESPT